MKDWCDVCFADTEHYQQTRSAKMLALGTTCKVCRKKACASSSAKERRRREAAIRRAARIERQEAKVKAELAVLSEREVARRVAALQPRLCPRCGVVTERVSYGRGTHCLPCKQRRDAERRARAAALRSTATPKNPRALHVANPHAPCPKGHHDWNPQGYCRACLRLKHRWNRTNDERVAADMCKRAKARAFRDDLAFRIGPGDLLPMLPACPCCGEGFNVDVRERRRSLDKKIPSLGYVPGNVEVICVECNTIKGASGHRRIMAVANRQAGIEQNSVSI